MHARPPRGREALHPQQPTRGDTPRCNPGVTSVQPKFGRCVEARARSQALTLVLAQLSIHMHKRSYATHASLVTTQCSSSPYFGNSLVPSGRVNLPSGPCARRSLPSIASHRTHSTSTPRGRCRATWTTRAPRSCRTCDQREQRVQHRGARRGRGTSSGCARA